MAQDDNIITMQKEVEAALARPAESVKWGMLIDTRKCVGCHACTIGCVSEYKLPPTKLKVFQIWRCAIPKKRVFHTRKW